METIQKMNDLLADAESKDWKILHRYSCDDGWFQGNIIEYAVLMKGRGDVAKFAHVHLSSGSKNAHLMRQCESGGFAYWEAS